MRFFEDLNIFILFLLPHMRQGWEHQGQGLSQKELLCAWAGWVWVPGRPGSPCRVWPCCGLHCGDAQEEKLGQLGSAWNSVPTGHKNC